jgi:peptidoglycan/LPS O-acetylase OafA/YrhL
VTAAILGGILAWHVVRGGHPDASVNVLHFVRELTLTTAMPMVGDGLMWNDPSWSISVEAWVYVIAFPVIALVGYRIAPKAAALGLLIILAAFGGWLMTMDSGDWEKVGWIAFGRAVVEFSAGWAAYRLFGKLTIPALLTDALAILLPIVLVAVRVMTGKEAWFLMPLFPVFVLGLTNAKSVASRLMSTRLMVWLGDVSYSIYLLHTVLKFLLTPIAVKLHLEHSPVFWTPFGFVVILASWATYVAFETPARRLLSRLLDPKDKPEPAVARATF